jgi:dTDP-4-dehydrorhamnose 3,5-epimerase
MQRKETSLPGVILLEPKLFGDERGYFFESYHLERFAALGITDRFVQDNHSHSVKNTLRGLHYQLNRPQAKLCRVVQGRVLDVVVDIRSDSPTFGQHETVELSDKNSLQIYVPEGFAHGFLVLSETADFLYKCSDFYDSRDEHGLAWDDPKIAIRWNVENPILSEKDKKHLPLSQIPIHKLPKMK